MNWSGVAPTAVHIRTSQPRRFEPFHHIGYKEILPCDGWIFHDLHLDVEKKLANVADCCFNAENIYLFKETVSRKTVKQESLQTIADSYVNVEIYRKEPFRFDSFRFRTFLKLIGSVRFGMFCSPVRRSSACVFADMSWLGPVRFGSSFGSGRFRN